MTDILRTTRSTHGNTTIQTTTHTDGDSAAMVGLACIGIVVAVLGSPFIPIFWGVYKIIDMGQNLGWPPGMAVAGAAAVAAMTSFQLYFSKPFRYVYFFLYSCGLAAVVYGAASDKWDQTWGGFDAALTFLISLIIGGLLANYREVYRWIDDL